MPLVHRVTSFEFLTRVTWLIAHALQVLTIPLVFAHPALVLVLVPIVVLMRLIPILTYHLVIVHLLVGVFLNPLKPRVRT